MSEDTDNFLQGFDISTIQNDKPSEEEIRLELEHKRKIIKRKLTKDIDDSITETIMRIKNTFTNICYPIKWFTDQYGIEQRKLTCQLCGGIPRFPMQDKEGQLYGLECFYTLVDKLELKGYDSDQKYVKTNIPSFSIDDFNKDQRAMKQIEKLRVLCPFCDELTTINQLCQHIKEYCINTKVQCYLCQKSYLTNHIEEHSKNCLQACKYGCQQKIAKNEFATHLIQMHLEQFVEKIQTQILTPGTRLLYHKNLKITPRQKYIDFEIVSCGKETFECTICRSTLKNYKYSNLDRSVDICLYCACRGYEPKCNCGRTLYFDQSKEKCHLCKNNELNPCFRCISCKYNVCGTCRSIMID